MITLVLSKVPEGLRGHLTKWLMEIAPGVFVGDPSARVRDLLWDEVCDGLSGGNAVMVFNSDVEQGYEFRNVGSAWTPVDFEGIHLIRRPAANDLTQDPVKSPIPRAARYRRARTRPK